MSSTSPNASAPEERDPSSAIRRLRAEYDLASSAPAQAVLLHELGVLEERVGDEPAAARDHLAAVNVDSDFREPLERLVAIIERRQSYKNLGKVLERLARVGETAGERSRALVDQAAFLVDLEGDLDGAKEALLEACEEAPDDVSVWLALELVAERSTDLALSERAIAARAELTQTPTLRALLLIDLAERRAEQGNVEGALDALDRAIGAGERATFLAVEAQERLARAHDLPEVEARALETKAELILRAIGDPQGGDERGVPLFRRGAAEVADIRLRAAAIHRRRADVERAVALLDRTMTELAGELAVVHARLELAGTLGDRETAARLAEKELELGVGAEPGAALWLLIADAALARDDREAALNAAQKALELAPASAAARALELDLLARRSDPARLATALEGLTEQLEAESAKANAYLASADTWARLGRDVSGAKAALTQAAMFGAAPAVIARVARLLAALVGDAAWYEEATRRLLAQGATEDEQLDLWLELCRARAQRKDILGATAALNAIGSTPGGAWLGAALGAYVLPWLTPAPEASTVPPPNVVPWAPLASLAELETEPEAGRAIRIVVALRALVHGDTESAIRELSALHDADASDLVVMGALALLLQGAADPARARDVLSRSADEVEDAEMAATLHIATGVSSWRLGERRRAVDAFQRAAETRPEAAGPMLGWALCAAEPNDASARAKALEALAQVDPELLALERFALEVGRGGSAESAWEALHALDVTTESELTRSGELARALWGLGLDADTSRREALGMLATRSSEAARVSRAALHRLELGVGSPQTPDPALALDSAEAWTRAETSAAPALEWLAAATALRDNKREVEARRALAERLGPPASGAIAASAALVAELTGQTPTPLPYTDDPHVALANLELSPPSVDPGQRGRALLDACPHLGEECVPITTAMAGFNQLAAGDVDGAINSFRSVVEAYPSEVIGWEGLRAAALAQGDRATLAEASAALGDAVGDPSLGARLWEEAATILLDELGDGVRGEFALSRAAERDIARFSTFDRLFRIVRARKDGPKLLDLIERRLKVATETQEIVRLVWERARALREAGDREGALRALSNVRELEPNHVGALALTGEICITLQRFEEAAENLAQLSAHPDAPPQQRLVSGVASVDLYENRLKNPERALEILAGLYRAGLSTLPVRERLARTAARVNDWDQATELLEQLMVERDTSASRIEAARLAMAIYRDQIGMPEAAQNAVGRLLDESPDDGEALDLVLTGPFAESVTRALLERGLGVLVGKLGQNSLDRDRIDRMARIAGYLGRLPMRQAALGALVALGADPRQIDPELAGLDERVARLPRIAIDDASLPSLIDPEDGGPLSTFLRMIASTIAEALGPGLAGLGVGKRERIDPRAGLALRNEVAAWAGALGIGEFDFYVGGNDPQGVCAVATETPAIVVGRDVAAPLSAFHRQAVARELFALRRGTSILRHREPEEIHALLVAACRVAEVEIPSPAFAMLPEFQRQLSREMPRRIRKALPEIAREIGARDLDIPSYYRAATSTLDRLAAVAAGDVSWVLCGEPRQRGRVTATIEGQHRMRRLLAFVLSPTYLELRDKLGMGVR